MPEIALLLARDGDSSSKLREWSSLIGIVTAIVGNILISFALNIQRYAHIRLTREHDETIEQWGNGQNSGSKTYGTQQSDIAEERAKLNLENSGDAEAPSKDLYRTAPSDDRSASLNGSTHSLSSSNSTIKQIEKQPAKIERKTYLRSPYWWVGIVLMIIGEAGNFIAYGFAPASIVSPLGVVALVSNCIIAPAFLKERFRQRDFWGVLVAIGGAVIIVLSAKNSETKMGPRHVWAAITRWEFETYLGITAALMVLLMLASEKYGEKTVLIDLGLVALFGGYTALSTKGVASLLSDTLWRVLTFPITYLLVFVLVITALLQIRYVNRALQRFDSTQVIPVQFVLFTISVIIGSAILYRDFQSATADRVGKFIGGCALTFLGVYLITSGRARESDDQDIGNIGREEDAIGLIDEEGYQDEIENDEDHRKRKSSAGVVFGSDEDDGARGSRRSSRQQSGVQRLSPRTPPTPLSHASSVSSRLTTGSETIQSPLLDNPWRSSEQVSTPSARPGPPEVTISSPLLPSESQRSGLSTPSTPPPWNQKRLSLSRNGRPSTLSRQSIARLTPGPLLAPLSSPLSAVVADSLRKGMDSVDGKRRPRLRGTQKARSQRATRSSSGGETVIGSSPLKSGQRRPDVAIQSDSPNQASRSRSQSIKDSMGEFLRLKQERSKGKANERDVEDDTQR